MNTKILREANAEAPVKTEKGLFRVVLARPGKGSSGNYSAEVFARDGAAAFPAGSQAFISHDPERKVTDLIGIYPEGAQWDSQENALVADLKVFKHWQDFVEEVYPHVGMSIYVFGEADEDDNVTRLIPNPLNGCDMVARPGLVGSGIAEKLYEAAKSQISEKPGAPSAQETNRKESTIMDPEIKEAFDRIAALLETLVEERDAKAAAEKQVEADEKAVAEGISAYEAARDAIDAAELLPSQAASLKEDARKGIDVAPLIEKAIKIRDEARADVAESGAPAGRVITGDKTSKFGAWA